MCWSRRISLFAVLPSILVLVFLSCGSQFSVVARTCSILLWMYFFSALACSSRRVLMSLTTILDLALTLFSLHSLYVGMHVTGRAFDLDSSSSKVSTIAPPHCSECQHDETLSARFSNWSPLRQPHPRTLPPSIGTAARIFPVLSRTFSSRKFSTCCSHWSSFTPRGESDH